MKNKKTLKSNINKTISNKNFFKFLVISNIALFSAYLFFVGSTTVQVVARKNVEESTRALQSTRASLEETYNEASKIYTKDYARSLGFIEAMPMFYTSSSVTAVAYDAKPAF